MDLIDKLNELATRIHRQKDTVLTEEAAKTAFVLPFLQALGYDVFNPSEVIPELTADHGVKKGEKVDYAIRQGDRIVILIECKSIGTTLSTKCAGQLFRYFAVTEAKFGVLTDGIRYIFFSDLENENKMDDRPFFEFNLFQFNENQVDELKKFTKSSFDLDTIISTASNLKYHKALLAEIKTEFESKNAETGKMENRFFGPHITVVPNKQAVYNTGKEALINYLKDNSKEHMKVIKGDNLGAIKISFIVTKNGIVSDVKHDAMTTGYPSIDEKLIELIKNIPGKWTPAENSKGEKIDYEFVFTFGPRASC